MLTIAVTAAIALATLAPVAGAVVVRTPTGQLIGVLLHRGVNNATLPGSIAAQRSAGGAAGPSPSMVYNGGPVLHSSSPYLVFWTPSGQSIPAGSQTLLKQFLTSAAGHSGKRTNLFRSLRQYYDAAGFADYQQRFSASQVITDTAAYPARDRTNCPDVSSSYPYCITDSQLQTELARMIRVDGLPSDGATGASQLPAQAPIYAVVLPSNVNVCTPGVQCVDNVFCSYHSSFADNGNQVLYAMIPMLPSHLFPKTCQDDGNSAVQEPNGDPADVVLKYLSHEESEAITDPFVESAWVSASGQEVADNCNQYDAQRFPNSGEMPDAFTPTLGGSAPAGTLYNQAIGAHRYYLQGVWSNGDSDCRLRPSSVPTWPRGSSCASAAWPARATGVGPPPPGCTCSAPVIGRLWRRTRWRAAIAPVTAPWRSPTCSGAARRCRRWGATASPRS